MIGAAIGRVEKGRRALADLGEFALFVNSWFIDAFCATKFPAEYRTLDDGDKIVIRSFLDPEPFSNTRSLLGNRVRLQPPESELQLRATISWFGDLFGEEAQLARLHSRSSPQMGTAARSAGSSSMASRRVQR